MQAAQNLFAGEQGVAYIPMPKGRGFTAHFGKKSLPRCRGSDVFCLEGSAAVSYILFSLAVRVIYHVRPFARLTQ